VHHDLTTMFVGRADDVDPGEVERAFEELEAEAHERLEAEGVAPAEMLLQRHVDMRYVGQWRSMAIPVPRPLTALAPIVDR
uniref:hypothetical protein n=1 Tax=Klebsiella pneumoniae TaxID=573 RepID=UPI0025A035D5